jgi:LmbE family N-acetylglucosaminyl deacetylase
MSSTILAKALERKSVISGENNMHRSGSDGPTSVARFADPAEVFQGVVVITVPHMDDEVLACGGTIARLPQKDQIHLIYATDGSRSPAPALPGFDAASPDLGLIREQESRAALKLLGVPEKNLHFLGFPEARLKAWTEEYRRSLIELIRTINPDHVITPFRYDRHPDHLVVNRATTEALRRGDFSAKLSEYFVYYRWRLLPGGDVRKYIRPDHLIRINIEHESATKRLALDCFRSQTTKLYSWQDRPILPQTSLDEVCRNPELFLRYDPLFSGTSIFVKAHRWIQFVHLIETPPKKKKDKVRALLYRCKYWRGHGVVTGEP